MTTFKFTYGGAPGTVRVHDGGLVVDISNSSDVVNVVDGDQLRRDLLLSALHMLLGLVNDGPKRDLGEIKVSPAPAGTATTAASRIDDGVDKPGSGWDSLGMRISAVHTLSQRLEGRVDRLERQAKAFTDFTSVAADTYRKLGDRVTKLESSATAAVPLQEHVNDLAMELLKRELLEHYAKFDQRVANLDQRVTEASANLVDRVTKIEATASNRGGLREASWLYQAVNITLDDIDELLPSLKVYADNPYLAAQAANGLKRHEVRAALRDLVASSSEAQLLYEIIDSFESNSNTIAQAYDFYVIMREKLIMFAVDLCTRTGLPPAPAR